jgi:hypothetical protein
MKETVYTMITNPYVFSIPDGSSIEVFSEDHETFFFQVTGPSSLVDVFHYNIRSEACYPEDVKATASRSAAIAYFLEHFRFEIG